MSTQGQDVVGRLDDDDLETIAICIKNGQPGRVTPYEIKAMCEELISLRTLLSSSRGEQGWRTIDSAPKDGTRFLAWGPLWRCPFPAQFPDPVTTMVWIDTCEVQAKGRREYATHWMPLPSAPGSVPTSLAGQGTDGTEGDADLCDDCGSALGPGEGGDHGEPNRCDACNVTRREIDRPVTDPTDGGGS